MDDTPTFKKLNLDIESDFLVSLVKDGEKTDSILSLGITTDHFFLKKNRMVAKVAFDAIYNLGEPEDGQPAIPPSVIKTLLLKETGYKDSFKSEKELDDYIVRLYSLNVPKGDTLGIIAENLIKTSKENLLKYQFNKTLAQGNIDDSDLADLQKAINAVQQSRVDSYLITHYEEMTSGLADAEQKIEDSINGIITEDGVTTGISKLDTIAGGFRPGQTIVIGARPGIGKTSLAINIAVNYSNKYPHKNILIFSLEMNTREIDVKITCVDLNLSIKQLREGLLNEECRRKIKESIEQGKGKNIFYCNKQSITVYDIRSVCMKLQLDLIAKGMNLDLVIVDYIQLISSTKTNAQRENQVSEISRILKILPGELKCPLIVLAQTNREIRSRKENEHHLSDLRESGSIEQDADIVIFLTEEEVNTPREHTVAHVAKNRMGANGKVKLKFDKPTGIFSEYDETGNTVINITGQGTTYTSKSKKEAKHFKTKFQYDDDRLF